MPISQGIINLIYSTWLHNSEAIAYFVGILFSLFLLFKHPTRAKLLLLIGFTSLLLQFEYVKHIADPLQRQTIETVVTTDGHFLVRRLLDLFFNDAITVGLYGVGWGSIFLAILLLTIEQDSRGLRIPACNAMRSIAGRKD